MLSEIGFWISHPFASVKTGLVRLSAGLHISETPLIVNGVDTDLIINLPTSQAAAMLGLISKGRARPSIDYEGREPKLGVVPLHRDL